MLDAHAHVGAWVLLAGGAGPWKRVKGEKKHREREIPQVHSQATIRLTAEAKQCRTHAEGMHSRKTGLHHVGLEEKNKEQTVSSHEAWPAVRMQFKKYCLMNPASCWVKLLHWEGDAQAPGFRSVDFTLFEQGWGEHQHILSVNYCKKCCRRRRLQRVRCTPIST